MKKTTKRILALLLTVTALLCLMVPAVSAEETAASELETVVYNLDGDTIFAAIAKNTTNKVTPAPTTGTTYYGFAGNKDLPAAISEAYKAGNINWEIGVHNGLLIANNATYLRADAIKGIRFCMQNDANGDPVNTRVGRWVSIPITAPSAGTYNFEIKHGIRNEGIDEVGFYVISYNTDAMTQAGVQALIDEVVAGREAEGIKKVGTYSCIGDTSTEEVTTDSLSGSYTFNSNDKYMIVLRADASDKTSDKYIYVSNITMTPSVAKVGDTGYATLADAIEAAEASETDKTVTLLQNVTEDSAVIFNKGVNLDLNGKTLTSAKGTVCNGVLTDSSENSTGAVVGGCAASATGEGEIFLYDGQICRVIDYTLDADPTPEVKEDGTKRVTFWYTLKFKNPVAYQMIADDEEAGAFFNIGAKLTFEDSELNVTVNEGTVAGWAGAMAKDPNAGYAFYITVTGFESLDSDVSGDLEAMLWVKGGAATGRGYSEAVTYGVNK